MKKFNLYYDTVHVEMNNVCICVYVEKLIIIDLSVMKK